MPARTGEQVLQKLREQSPEIWLRGERVKDVTTHPGLAGGVHSLAELYDLQWRLPELMLFDSPDTGDKVGRSHMIPRTREELLSVGEMMMTWTRHSNGMMGRSPDY
jgi:4-hydroxyphenylacetate 3-monooxygenase